MGFGDHDEKGWVVGSSYNSGLVKEVRLALSRVHNLIFLTSSFFICSMLDAVAFS